MIKKQSFVFGAFILAISGIVCKILGAVYKIPLTNILGSQGMGVYYLIFPVYAFLLTLTSSSFTTAISRLVSNQIALKNSLYAYKIFKASLILLAILGVGASIILACFSRVIASLQGLENAYICYLAVAPSIILVSLSSSFKGYFQGLQNMLPTAISQVLGQIFKLSMGFTLAKILSNRGVIFGCIGAILGITISEIITTLYFVFAFLIFKFKNKNYFKFKDASTIEISKKQKDILKEVFKTALPFTLSSVILPMSMVIDSFLIVNILKSMQFDKIFATSLLGLNSGVVNTLVSLPSTLSVAICMSIVPYITFALSKKDYNSINEKTALAIKLTIIVSLPCVAVFSFFSPYILRVLFASTFSSSYEFSLCCSLLVISSINVFYLGFLQISTALLQAINRSYIPVASLSIALIIKVICEVFLISMPIINIAGAVISNAICYFISSVINIFYFKKQINVTFSFKETIFSPLIASLLMCLLIFILLNIFNFGLLGILITFLIGAIFYTILIFKLKTFTPKEKSALLFFKRNTKK